MERVLGKLDGKEVVWAVALPRGGEEPVRGWLKPDEVVLLEDGKPEKITLFEGGSAAQGTVPVELILLFDLSGRVMQRV